MRFKIDWTGLIVGSKFTVFALFYFVYLRTMSKYKPPGDLYSEGRFRFTEGFLCYEFEGFIFGGAYTWGAGGYFSEFYGIFLTAISTFIFVQVMLPVSMNSSHTSSCP